MYLYVNLYITSRFYSILISNPSVIVFQLAVRSRWICSMTATLDLSLNTISMIVLPRIAADPQALA